VKISANKIEVMAVKAKYMRWAKIVVDGNIIKQTNTFKYLGCNIL
jgi:hypothetical protein